jgi:hypothetical protein
MDRGIPTDEVLAEMRQADPPVSYPNLTDWGEKVNKINDTSPKVSTTRGGRGAVVPPTR